MSRSWRGPMRFIIALLACCPLLPEAAAQSYPTKPVRIYAAQIGTSIDMVLRLITEPLALSLGQRFVIENRGIVGVETAARAAPDGYTLLSYTNPLWLMPLFQDNVPWDPVKDFAPITLTTTTPNVVVVHPSLPAQSIRELIALARARPGALNYGSTSTGNANHVAAELFKAMAHVNIVRINYKGGAQAMGDLVTGQLHLMFASAGNATPHVKSGRLRALAVTSASPSPLAPGLPTVASAGLPGYESTSSTGMFAPAKTPPAIINRLNQEIVRSLNAPGIRERLLELGIEVVASPPSHLAATIQSEMTRMAKVIRDANLREAR